MKDCVYMDFSILVLILILVLVILGVMVTCTQGSLHVHIPIYMMNISIPVSNNCIIFVQVHVMFIFYSINCRNFYNLGKIRPLYLTAELAL